MITGQHAGLLHGADYNYEQWLNSKDLLDNDLLYMREAGINVLAVGIFSWSLLESDEGVYNFGWLDECFERLYQNGQKIILATPSGSKPAWLSEKYPEVCQVTANGIRQTHGGRHNHCRSSVKYREACVRINTRLAERYGTHPALILWHVSNEYNGMHCYCPQCLAAFRSWLKKRYETLDALNAAWYTAFWSHHFTAWEQIYPADPSIHGLMLDWQRFISDQTIDFFLAETEPLRRITPGIPITTNFQMPDVGLDFHKFARHLDIISWDNYPEWHNSPDDGPVALKAAFFHDLSRSYLGKPFLMMESSPGATNWQGVSKKKKKGMHVLSSIQAVAHGSDSVQYFQWRQSRGGAEKFHDAVITHFGADDTRIFREVAETGSLLKKLSALAGTATEVQAAVVYDFQNGWALDNAQLPRSIEKNYQKECIAQYGAFWKAGISCDVISPEYSDFERYRLIVFPMLYMLSEKTAEKIRSFVRQGGVAVATYLTGMVNESDLCYLGGTPGNLTDVFGLAVEETETIAGYETQEFLMNGHNWKASHYADRIRLRGGAQVLAVFTADTEELPAVTANEYEKGTAYYLCTRTEQTFMDRFYRELCEKHGVQACVPWEIPAGVSVRERGGVLFVMNFNCREIKVLSGENVYTNLLNGETVSGTVSLQPYGVAILADKSDSGEKKSKAQNNPE
ncbi:MAG: beta-galactosidase [Treponema sp.]|jgi:beta-galactosidase|nr:beta-galactosidase [Treponema sp.]